jgi:cysteine desulfurase
LGKIEVDFASLGVHAMSLSGHKIYGPKGVGALVVDKRVELMPQISGGGHEKGLRAGTENVPAIVGFGLACELADSRRLQDAERIGALRSETERGVAALGGVIFGSEVPRLANTSYFAFPGIEGETLLMALDRSGFAVASGSACSSGSAEPSAVLMAMGVAPALAKGAIRVSLGRANTGQQVQDFITVLQVELARLRSMLSVAMV